MVSKLRYTHVTRMSYEFLNRTSPIKVYNGHPLNIELHPSEFEEPGEGARAVSQIMGPASYFPKETLETAIGRFVFVNVY